MKEKIFSENVEKNFSSLSEEEKAEYLGKENNYYKKVYIVSILLTIIAVIAIIGVIALAVITKNYGYFVAAGLFAVLGIIFIWCFVNSAKILKLPNDTKVKTRIERLEKQKQYKQQEEQKRIENELNKNVHYRLKTEKIKSVTILDSYTEISDKLHAVLNYQEIIQTRIYKFNVVYNDGSSKVITAAETSEEYAVLMPLVGKEAAETEKTTAETSSNNIEQLREYKKLLDEGVITQEEFDAKKKQLLN